MYSFLVLSIYVIYIALRTRYLFLLFQGLNTSFRSCKIIGTRRKDVHNNPKLVYWCQRHAIRFFRRKLILTVDGQHFYFGHFLFPLLFHPWMHGKGGFSTSRRTYYISKPSTFQSFLFFRNPTKNPTTGRFSVPKMKFFAFFLLRT